MTVGELLKYCPSVDTVDFYVRDSEHNQNRRDHTVCGLCSCGGISSEDSARELIDFAPLSYNKIAVTVKE